MQTGPISLQADQAVFPAPARGGTEDAFLMALLDTDDPQDLPPEAPAAMTVPPVAAPATAEQVEPGTEPRATGPAADPASRTGPLQEHPPEADGAPAKETAARPVLPPLPPQAAMTSGAETRLRAMLDGSARPADPDAPAELPPPDPEGHASLSPDSLEPGPSAAQALPDEAAPSGPSGAAANEPPAGSLRGAGPATPHATGDLSALRAAHGALIAALTQAPDGCTELELDLEDLGLLRVVLRAEGDRVALLVEAAQTSLMDLCRRHVDSLCADLRSAGFTRIDLGFGSADADSDTPHTPFTPDAAPTEVGQPLPPLPLPARQGDTATLYLRL